MAVLNCLRDPVRLKHARGLMPVEPGRHRALTRLAALAAELAEAPVALVTIVEDDRQVFAAQFGLPEDLARAGETPIEYSICQFAVASERPLIVGNLAGNPMFSGHPAVDVLGVAAYAGVPIVMAGSHTIGTLCVLDMTPREWADDVLARLALLADLATDQFELQTHERREAFRQTWRAIPERRRW